MARTRGLAGVQVVRAVDERVARRVAVRGKVLTTRKAGAWNAQKSEHIQPYSYTHREPVSLSVDV